MPRLKAVLTAIAALAFLATACMPQPGGDLPPVGAELVAQEKARCERGGGIWGRGGAGGGFVCFQRTRDANQSCTRESDCQSFCLARSRTCAPLVPFLGCHDVLTDNGTRAMVCVD